MYTILICIIYNHIAPLPDMIFAVVLFIHVPESTIPDPVVCAIFLNGKIVFVYERQTCSITLATDYHI
jgi:hypothetical protein